MPETPKGSNRPYSLNIWGGPLGEGLKTMGSFWKGADAGNPQRKQSSLFPGDPLQDQGIKDDGFLLGGRRCWKPPKEAIVLIPLISGELRWERD